MQNLKRNGANELIFKIETLTDLENKLKVASREGQVEGIVRELGMDVYTVIFKMNNQQGPTL